MYVVYIWKWSSAHALGGVSGVASFILLMNSFNKTEAAVFSCRLCFMRAFPFISLFFLNTFIIHDDKCSHKKNDWMSNNTYWSTLIQSVIIWLHLFFLRHLGLKLCWSFCILAKERLLKCLSDNLYGTSTI